MAVLHPPQILAFAAFVLVLALDLAGSVPEALVMASELGWRFDLDVHFDEANGAVGPDLAEVEGRRSAHEFLIVAREPNRPDLCAVAVADHRRGNQIVFANS